MAFTIFGRTIPKIGVIGSRNIDPDIALHFSRNLYAYGVPRVVVDIAQAALDAGSKKNGIFDFLDIDQFPLAAELDSKGVSLF